MNQSDFEQRRKAARRTAWILAVVALLVFSAFLLTGITGRS